MNTRLPIILLAVAIIAIIPYLLGGSAVNDKYSQVCFRHSCVDVELADNPAARDRGLMHRRSLAAEKGMLFVFEGEGIYPFWMKNTLIPLDIIWLDSEFLVVHIEHAVPCREYPCPHYNPEKNARYVLEVNEGYAGEHNIAVGDKLVFK